MVKVTELTRQYSVFQSVLTSWAKSVDLSTQALSSNGYALKQQETYMQSIEAKTKALESDIAGKWQNFISSSTLTGAIDSVKYLVDAFGNLKTVLTLVGTAILAFQGNNLKNTFANLIPNIKSSYIEMVNYQKALLAAKLAQEGMTEAEIATALSANSLKFAFIGLGQSLKALFLSNPLGVIAIGITSVVTAIDIYNQHQEKMKQQIEETATKAKESVDSLSELVGKYNELNAVVNKDDSTRQQLKATQEAIIKLLGIEKDAIDLVNGSYEANIKKIREKSEVERWANERSLQVKYNLAKETAQNAQGGASSAFNGDQEYHPSFIPDTLSKEAFNTLKEAKIPGLDFSNNQISSTFQGAEKRIEAVNQALKILENNGYRTSDVYNQLSISAGKYQEVINNEKNALDDLIKIKVQNNALGTPNKDNYQQYKDSVVDAIAKDEKWTNVTKEQKQLIYDLVDNLYPQFSQAIKQTTDDSDKLYSQYSNSFNSSVAKIREYNEILNDIENNKAGVSDSTYKKIKENYQELLPYLGDEVALRDKITESIHKEEETEKTAYINMLEYNEDFYNKKILGNNQVVKELEKDYGIELSNYKNLAEAKYKVEQELINAISKKWGEFYDTQTNGFSDQWNEAKRVLPESTIEEIQSSIVTGINKVNEAKKKFDDIALNSSNMDLSTINLTNNATPKTSSSGTGGTQQEVDTPEKLIEKDYLASITQRIKLKQSEIDLNKALQDTSPEKDKIALMEKQIKLQEQQQNLYHEEADTLRKRRDELEQQLKPIGINFAGTGDDRKATNAVIVLQQEEDKINKLINQYNNASKDGKKAINAELSKEKELYSDLKTKVEAYLDITSSKIPDIKKQWTELSKAIGDVSKETEELAKNSVKDLLDAQEKADKQALKLKKQELDKNLDQTNKNLFPVSQEEYEKYHQERIEMLKKEGAIQATIDEMNSLTYDKIKDFKQIYEDIHTTKVKDLQTQVDSLEKSKEVLTEEEKVASIKDLRLKLVDYNLNKLQDQRITKFDDELSQLEKINNVEQERIDRLQKQIDLELQRQTLQNTQNEKNVQVYHEGQGFVWEADQKKVREESQKLADMELDYIKWDRQQNDEHTKTKLQSDIDTENKLTQARKDAYDQQKSILENAYNEQNDIVEQKWSNRESIEEAALKKLVDMYGKNYDKIYKYTKDQTDLLQSASAKISSFGGDLSIYGINDNSNSPSTSSSSNLKTRNGITYNPNVDYQAILNKNPNMPESERQYLLKQRQAKIDDIANSAISSLTSNITSSATSSIANKILESVGSSLINPFKVTTPTIPQVNNTNNSNSSTIYNFNIDKLQTPSVSNFMSQVKNKVNTN